MNPELIEMVESSVLVVCGFIAVAAIISGVYIVHVYRQRHEDALFLERLVKRDVRVCVAAAVILVYLALAMADLTPGRPWGAVIIAAAVIAMLVGPVDDALLWRRERTAEGRRRA